MNNCYLESMMAALCTYVDEKLKTEYPDCEEGNPPFVYGCTRDLSIDSTQLQPRQTPICYLIQDSTAWPNPDVPAVCVVAVRLVSYISVAVVDAASLQTRVNNLEDFFTRNLLKLMKLELPASGLGVQGVSLSGPTMREYNPKSLNAWLDVSLALRYAYR